ncbi:hypothetical protein [Trichormus sp. NMC-1]|uniref:hypothetical protein n=1 Tax=Trichormus sp. NMC-1 TaxID=1853259 RepID=UPI0008DC0FDE|nr:hypothetical protein [Trichormus sp. NMC-1]
MFKFIKFLLGRKVAQIQRNFPWPIKQEILKMPPIETRKQETNLVVLVQHKTFIEGLWTAWSWLYFLNNYLDITFVIDGEVTEKELNIFMRLFPNGTIVSLKSQINNCFLSNEFINQFYNQHPYGKVFLLKLSLQEKFNVLFSDPDILVFSDPVEIRERLKIQQGFYCTEPGCYSFDQRIFDRAKSLDIQPIRDFNSGLLYIPKNHLSSTLCYELMKGWTLADYHHFTEQTILDVMMSSSGATALPVSKYVVNSQGMWFWQQDMDYTGVKVRHFVGNVRHRMYLYGYPTITKTLFKNVPTK